MANYTTGSQRYNARMDKIMEGAKRNGAIGYKENRPNVYEFKNVPDDMKKCRCGLPNQHTGKHAPRGMYPIFYSLHCNQVGRIMASGKNSKTLYEVKEGLLSYLSGDHNEKEIKRLSKLSPDELAEMYDFTIFEHYELLDEEN